MYSAKRNVAVDQFPQKKYYVPGKAEQFEYRRRKITSIILIILGIAFVISLGLFIFYTIERIHILENDVQLLNDGLKEVRKLGGQIIEKLVKPQPEQLQDVSTCSYF